MRIKTEKYASMLLKEINNILYSEVKNKDIMGITAMYVNLTDDLSYAKVYCSVFDIEKKDKAISDLNKAKGFIKSILFKKKLPLRKMPDLEFAYDTSLEEAVEMDKKIEETLKKLN